MATDTLPPGGRRARSLNPPADRSDRALGGRRNAPSQAAWTIAFQLAFAVIVLWQAGCGASEAPAPPSTDSTAAAPVDSVAQITTPARILTAPATLERVTFIGASATHGFGAVIKEEPVEESDWPKARPVALSDVFRATLRPTRGYTVARHSSLFFYDKPFTIGPSLIDSAVRDNPTVLVAIDFLFWFGYGFQERMPDATPVPRGERLEIGLDLLDKFTCPIIVGDLPDMHSAVGLMLAETQIPDPRMLRALNQRIRAWAEARDHVILVPLADAIEAMRVGDVIETSLVHLNTKDAPMLLPDRLHPNVSGLIAMTHLAIAGMVDRNLVSSDVFRTDPEEIERVLHTLLAD